MAQHRVNSICPFCGVGCGLSLRIENETVLAVEPLPNHPVSQGQLCAKGWNAAFGIDPIHRIKQPYIRSNGSLQPASWQEALEYISTHFKQFLIETGPQSVGVISSARATNEDNYAAQKFARVVLGTNNVDHCARICHSPTVAGLKQTLGSGAMTNSVADLAETDLILVIGADPTENHSVLGGKIIRAKLEGKQLIVIDPRRTRLAKLADLHLQLGPGTNIALINAMLQEILANGWQDELFLQQRCEGVEPLAAAIQECNPEWAESITGVPAAMIRQAARAYSQSERAMILYGMGITQFVSGTDNVMALADLALVCGQIGREGTGVNPLRGQNNVQGACDMGCLPNVYPGYQLVSDTSCRDKFSAAWKADLPSSPGLTSQGMVGAMLDQQFRGLILFGEDQVVTDPDQNRVRKGLQQLDLLVVAELHWTETAKLADVVLPAASFAEKDGTFTNAERRVQRIYKAVSPPGEAMVDWQWMAALARQLGSSQLDWQDSEAIFDELAALTPIYSGMSYAAIKAQQGLQWPCNASAPGGTTVLHQEQFPIGKARLMPVDYRPINEPTDQDYPLILTTNRLHYHYGCGSMTRQSPTLERETPAGVLFINPQDAADLRLNPFDAVAVKSRRGYLETRAVVTEDVPQGLVSMPYHFREAPSNQLTNTAEDPLTHMPELKACAVAVQPLPTGSEPRPMETIWLEQD